MRIVVTAGLADILISQGDPIDLFGTWLEEARASEPSDSNAMALATAALDGTPSVRTVLLKGHGPDGFVFNTNSASRKGRELEDNAKAALLFHWKSLRRQVRIEGIVVGVDKETADTYFVSRPIDSQLGALASDQSSPLESRAVLLERFEDERRRHAHQAVRRPAYWSGYRIVPFAMEFWLDRPHRLHERRRFSRSAGFWTSTLLFP